MDSYRSGKSGAAGPLSDSKEKLVETYRTTRDVVMQDLEQVAQSQQQSLISLKESQASIGNKREWAE
jgi:hypothetical protein